MKRHLQEICILMCTVKRRPCSRSICNILNEHSPRYDLRESDFSTNWYNSRRWTLFVCLTMESLLMLIATLRLQHCKSSSGDEIDCLRVAICSTLVRCYRCISILIILPVVRWCSLIGPHKSAVVLFDRGYPSFGNVDSAIPIDVVRMKSHMDSLFDPTCVSVGVTINNVNLTPNRNMPRFFIVLRNRRGLSTRKPYVSVKANRNEQPNRKTELFLHRNRI